MSADEDRGLGSRGSADTEASSGSSGSPIRSEWTPYARRSEWADVKPLPQDDGPDPVVRIAYSDKFVDVYDYFRAIYASREVSQRALSLTRDAVELNPANYTAWHHRRFLLKALKEKGGEDAPNLDDELAYIREIIEVNPKNYQVWEHRRAIVEWLNVGDKELRFCEIILAEDPKNYHCWQHRQWAIKTFNLYDGELEFIDRLLEEDVRNNSAWNQRFFVVSHEAGLDNKGDGAQRKGTIGGSLLQREIDYVKKAIDKVPDNESAWNYLTGLLDRCHEAEASERRKDCLQYCQQELYHSRGLRSSYLLAALVDLLAAQIENDSLPEEEKNVSLTTATQMCEALASEHDVIRKHYWTFIRKDLRQRFATNQ